MSDQPTHVTGQDQPILKEELFFYSTLSISSQCMDIFWVDIFNYCETHLKLNLFYEVVAVLLERNAIKINVWAHFEVLLHFYLSIGNNRVG